MTNEELIVLAVELKGRCNQIEANQESINNIISEIKDDIKATKSLAEDVHIMAINMKNMQETLDETNKKVDLLNNRDLEEYRDTKKQFKNNIISGICGALIPSIIGVIVWIVESYKIGG
ncbi:MAG: hypothetical protein MJ191_00110 [Clostridium sp.]|nr:hypothetical protein [Clostridium sp.]